ncbi:MAG TPA: hypothetical protein PLM56_12615 [Cyclobacteriaceae bacterium]|jgi:hypothetical protein|nr:hypothetical protein [Cytophagales bacterium]HMR58860.1 hypothetical protein [Cyclobacteriaceae bacterium]HRE68264.1 hypothetical protein [Cyclobacteriaceae bacterium]HRF34338.1 hypothetical protein [Cyclobacteriaceae bacterium]
MSKILILFWFQLCILILITFLSSCNEDMPVIRDPCDFIISTEEASLDVSTACNECFLKLSFQGRLYDFKDNRINTFSEFFGNESLQVNRNDFFEFKFKSLKRSSDLFASLNEQRALLTPDSLMLTDFNFFQPSFLLRNRCGVEYQVAKNTNIFFPDISHSTVTGISVWNFFIVDDGVNPVRYSTSYLISGTFSTQMLIDNKSESIGGSYALLFNITEP